MTAEPVLEESGPQTPLDMSYMKQPKPPKAVVSLNLLDS